ncbi:MAG: fibronectin type III domain-containing protein [Candidatus Zixiibacteriota bacterium]
MSRWKMMLAALLLAALQVGFAFSSALGQISNVQVSNLTSSSANITWTTSDTTDGCVNYGLTTALGDTTCDPRPDDDIHQVVITGLPAETTYYFEVISGGITDDNGGAYYTFTTTDVASGVPYVIFGYVLLHNGLSPIAATIVSAQVKSNGNTSYPLSGLTDTSGVWSLNLGNLKNAADGTVLSYSTGDSILIDAQGAANGVGGDTTMVSGSSPQYAGTIMFPNREPVLEAIGSQLVTEGDTLEFRVSATDPDQDSIGLSAENRPTNSSFTDSGDGAGSFAFAPGFTQADTYYVTIIASDGSLSDSEVVEIVVAEAGNQPPVLDSIGPKSVMEGDTLEFGIRASDVDLDPIILDTLNVPLNTTFIDSGNGGGSFTFTPDFAQADTYYVTFVAEDTVGATDSEVVEIVVQNVNRPPVLILDPSIDSADVIVGDTCILHLWSTDPDGQSLTLSTDILPTNSDFYDSGNGGGLFRLYPRHMQEDSVYHVTFIASDAFLADSQTVAMRVIITHVPGDANGDNSVNVGDVVYLVSYLYRNGPAPLPEDAGDANCDGTINVGDVVYLVSYLYRGGPPPGC